MNTREYKRTLKSLVADFIRDKQPEDVSYYQEVCDWLDSLPTDSKIGQIKAELQKRLLKYDPDMTNAGRELQEVLAFIDSLPAESKHPRLRNKESWISEAKREKSFIEYLRGVFEANNGVENDPDLLIALHGQTLFELAQKESAESPDFEAEWKRYTASRKDDMRTNAVTMNVKEVALYFAEWGAEHLKSNH